jgi:hypothetical protein
LKTKGKKVQVSVAKQGESSRVSPRISIFIWLKTSKYIAPFFQYLLRLLPIYYQITTIFQLFFNNLDGPTSEFSQFVGCMVQAFWDEVRVALRDVQTAVSHPLHYGS